MKKKSKWKKICPKCNKYQYYKTKKCLKTAVRLNKICINCSYKTRKHKYDDIEFNRICPSCNKIIEYKTYGGWYMANKRNSLCKKCSITGYKHTNEARKK